MAITTKRITMRQGNSADWESNKGKMLSAELAIVNDTEEIHFSPKDGKTKRIATEDDVSKLSEQIGNLDIGIDESEVNALIEKYVKDNNITGVTNEEIEVYVKQYIDENVSDDTISVAVTAWLDEHPEATTTVQDGSITEEKLHPDLVNTLKNSGTDKPYHLQKIGVLYENPEGYDYIAWCPGNLRYDEKLKKYVVLVYGSTQHVNGTTALFVSYIDPDTFEATAPVQCFTDDGATALKGSTAFWIEDDIYKMLYTYTDNATYIFTSTDYGVNWVKGDAVSGFSGSPWGITKLSNGRLICGDDGTKYSNTGINYSDNGGINWTKVVPTTANGDYEAEACILELKEGKLIAIARYSMSGIGYNESGASEPAIVSFSDDYGTTWTAWKKSETITNMNASSCTGYVHNGMVDIFACSRWYWHGSNKNDDYMNTGKTGAITHYTATVENALVDNFTNMGIVAYANAIGDTSSQDFHSPVMAVNGDDMLLMWFDRIYPFTEEKTSHYFARGSKTDLDTAPRDDLSSVIYPYSSSMVDKLLKQQYTKLMTKINEIVIAGGGSPDVGDDPENPLSYIFDGCIMNFNYLDSSKHDTANMTLTDSINGEVGTFQTAVRNGTVVTAFPEVRDNSMAYSHLYVPANTLSKYIEVDENNNYEFSIEYSCYIEDSDEYEDLAGKLPISLLYSDGNGGSSLRIHGTGLDPLYEKEDGTFANTKTSEGDIGSIYKGTILSEQLVHAVYCFEKDGVVKAYKNGTYAGKAIADDDFIRWAGVNLTRGFSFNGIFKSTRIYNRLLTENEILNNYNYELQSIV